MFEFWWCVGGVEVGYLVYWGFEVFEVVFEDVGLDFGGDVDVVGCFGDYYCLFG